MKSRFTVICDTLFVDSVAKIGKPALMAIS